MAEAATEFVELPDEAIERIGEVDRTETIEAVYACKRSPDGHGLQLARVQIDPPQTTSWSADDVRERIDMWRPELEAGGAMFGALSGGRLRGFSIISSKRADRTAELIALFVDAAHRGTGIGSELLRLAEERARESDATALYIGANPIVPCVDFYLAHGARIIRLTNSRLVRGLSGGNIVLAQEFDRPT